jgi:hypothetical protein
MKKGNINVRSMMQLLPSASSSKSTFTLIITCQKVNGVVQQRTGTPGSEIRISTSRNGRGVWNSW